MRYLLSPSIAVVIIFGCSKIGHNIDKNYMFDYKAAYIHIVCDSNRTGNYEPWLFEFAPRNVPFLTYDPIGEYYPNYAKYELPDTAKPVTKLSYLSNLPLIDSLVQTFTSGLNPTWYHHVFTINKALLGKTIFKSNSLTSEQYGSFATEKEYVTVMITTTDSSPDRAVKVCNLYLTDSIISKKGFVPVF